MKLKLQIFSAIIFFLILSCQSSMSQKFEWYPTECAPELYPINIVEGQIVLTDKSTVGIPSGSDMANGWGTIGTINLVGNDKKALPESVKVIWFSYIENEFYLADFALPTDAISSIFEKGFTNPDTKQKDNYDRIVVGLAPGGYVAVWAKGGQITTELSFFKASVINYDWQKFSRGIEKSRKEYIASALSDALDSNQRKLASIPLGWQGKFERDYRTVYPLSIANTIEKQSTGALISYYDGSAEFHQAAISAGKWNEHQTIPKRLVWNWESESGKKLSTNVVFDELETIAAFKKMHNEHPDNPLTLLTEVVPANFSVSIILKNEFSFIALKKWETTTYEQ